MNNKSDKVHIPLFNSLYTDSTEHSVRRNYSVYGKYCMRWKSAICWVKCYVVPRRANKKRSASIAFNCFQVSTPTSVPIPKYLILEVISSLLRSRFLRAEISFPQYLRKFLRVNRQFAYEMPAKTEWSPWTNQIIGIFWVIRLVRRLVRPKRHCSYCCSFRAATWP